MAVRFYLVPKIFGTEPMRSYRPAYISGFIQVWDAMTMGKEDVYLVGADVTPAEHTTISGNADVIAIPLNLDATLNAGAVTAAQNWMEARSLPSEWITTSHTSRDVLRVIGKICTLMQRFNGRQRRKFFESGVTLDSQLSDLTQAQRNALLDAATSLGLDTSGATGSTTIRQALRNLCQQLPSFTLAGQTF